MKIKKSTKILLIIFEIIFIILFLIILFLYQKGFDSLIFYTPKNTDIYLNLNYSNYTKPGNNFLKFLKDKDFLNIKELENIKKYYQKEISFFYNKNNNFGFILRKNRIGKNINTNIEVLERIINNNLSINSKLYVKEVNSIVYISNTPNLEIEKYKYFKDNYKDYLSIYLFKNQNFIKGLITNSEFENILNNINFKDKKTKITAFINDSKDLEFNIKNSNYKKIEEDEIKYNISKADENYILLNEINLLNFYQKLYKLSKNNEQFKWFMDLKANFEDKYKFNQEKIDTLLNNNSDVYINIEDKKINKFCILFDLKNLNHYINEIINVKDIFLQHAAMESPEIKEIKLEDGTYVKELIMNIKNVQFKELYKDKNKEIFGLKIENNGEVYYSLIDGRYFSIANDLKLINSIEERKNNNVLKISLKNIYINIINSDNNIKIIFE
ncbi:hypothetical protein K9M42_00305 [Patescibacteria group bacterium]|nr:hypothetical protein [Patescibacteria group bacterium]